MAPGLHMITRFYPVQAHVRSQTAVKVQISQGSHFVYPSDLLRLKRAHR